MLASASTTVSVPTAPPLAQAGSAAKHDVAPSSTSYSQALATHAAAMSKILQEESNRIEAERQALAQERANFESMKAKVASVHLPDRVKLNVGGQIFATSRETLRSEKNSMLHSMFSGSGFKVEKDEDGAYFIDRDGTHFRHIINFLRTGRAYIPDDEIELTELLDELDFYQITGYERVLRDATEVECTFASLDDANGILHWLGTNGKSEAAWRNPVTAGIVKVAHGGGNLLGGPAIIAERNAMALGSNSCGICKKPILLSPFGGAPAFGALVVGASAAVASQTLGGSDACLQLDLPFAVHLTAYSARHMGCQPPINWRVEGSNDGTTWIVLHTHTNDQALQGTAAHWRISQPDIAYRRFRWIAAPDECLHLCCIELYGTFSKQAAQAATPSPAPAATRRLIKPRRTKP